MLFLQALIYLPSAALKAGRTAGKAMIERKNPIARACLYIFLIAVVIVMLIPLAWMFSASLKTAETVFGTTIDWIPDSPQWENYLMIWKKIPFALFTFNSAKLTVIITVIQLITSSFAAYGFAKCKFKGRDLLFLCYVATIAIPWQVYMLPQYILIPQS